MRIQEYLNNKKEFTHYVKKSEKTYIKDASQAPEGANVQQGARGGLYYDEAPGQGKIEKDIKKINYNAKNPNKTNVNASGIKIMGYDDGTYYLNVNSNNTVFGVPVKDLEEVSKILLDKFNIEGDMEQVFNDIDLDEDDGEDEYEEIGEVDGAMQYRKPEPNHGGFAPTKGFAPFKR